MKMAEMYRQQGREEERKIIFDILQNYLIKKVDKEGNVNALEVNNFMKKQIGEKYE